MKNKDLYKEKLAKFKTDPALVNGKLVNCGDVDCKDCEFYQSDDDCVDIFKEWLDTELDGKKCNNTETDDTEDERYVLTQSYIMQLSLKDFNIEVSTPMARAIKDRFLELMLQHGHMRIDND